MKKEKSEVKSQIKRTKKKNDEKVAKKEDRKGRNPKADRDIKKSKEKGKR